MVLHYPPSRFGDRKDIYEMGKANQVSLEKEILRLDSADSAILTTLQFSHSYIHILQIDVRALLYSRTRC